MENASTAGSNASAVMSIWLAQGSAVKAPTPPASCQRRKRERTDARQRVQQSVNTHRRVPRGECAQADRAAAQA
eukprot:5565310-Prymnesium_polylepis.3